MKRITFSAERVPLLLVLPPDLYIWAEVRNIA